jgi:4-hydroxy-tetrahydrodipicolinate synthase
MPATEEPPMKKANLGAATPATMKIRNARLMTAIKTPYKPDGDIDYEAYDKLVDHQIANGVQGLIVGGTTGEGHLLGWDEHLMLITHAKAKFQDKILIVGNTGSNSTAESIYATKKGFAAGMDASLLINPYYGKTSVRGVVLHLEAGMRLGPAIIYNVPARTGQDIKPEIIMQIADNKHFAGVKECMGHERIKVLSDQGVVCWSGNDDQCYVSRREYGGAGVISVTANVVPGLMAKLMLEEKRTPELDALNAKLEPLFKWLFAEPNPIGVNTMLMMLGSAQPVFRLPYTYVTRMIREEGVQLVKSIGLEHMPAFGTLKVLEDSDFEHNETEH